MKKYSTLIVDDDATSIHIIKKILSSQFTDIESIHTAKSVNQGLEKYSLIKPDILLLDINLGNDTIFSLLEVIAPSESEVILISSHKDFAVEAVDHNIAAYVLKPVETSDLKKGILKAMGKIVKKEAALKNKLDFIFFMRKWHLTAAQCMQSIASRCYNSLNLICPLRFNTLPALNVLFATGFLSP